MAPLPIPRRHALLLAATLLVLLAVAGRTLAGGDERGAEPAAELVPAKPVAGAAAMVVVHVAGAVRQPGLYELKEGQRIADAIARAGGATAKADTPAVHLAAPLADGMQVLIPSRVAGAAGSAAAGPAAGGAATGARVSLSSATAEQLDELPGIGPVTAQKIVDYRAKNGGFRSVDDLDAIPGIGPARVEQLR